MSDAPVPTVVVTPASFMSRVDFTSVGKAAATVMVAGAVFFLEMTGHAPSGTFLNYVALPVLGFMGLHTAALNMQGTRPNA